AAACANRTHALTARYGEYRSAGLLLRQVPCTNSAALGDTKISIRALGWRSGWVPVRGLLTGHGHAHLAAGVGDEVAGEVDGDGMEGAGEGERAAVVGGDGRA